MISSRYEEDSLQASANDVSLDHHGCLNLAFCRLGMNLLSVMRNGSETYQEPLHFLVSEIRELLQIGPILERQWTETSLSRLPRSLGKRPRRSVAAPFARRRGFICVQLQTKQS